MRLVRVDYHSATHYGVLEPDGVVSLLAGNPYGADIADQVTATAPLAECRLLVPVEPTKIVAIGRNYAAHAAEMNMELGGTPSVFMKPLQTLVAHEGTVELPDRALSTEVQHEGELAVVIGKSARNVPKASAAEYILGFTCANDVSARDLQRGDPQITRGKGFDTFCPLGPFVETDIALDKPYEVTCSVNGELRQTGSTTELIFDIPTLIEFLTGFTTLAPGDVILTGSPAGTGAMTPGDVVEVTVEGVGTLRHSVAAFRG
jgi:2-keto-4-pentenoate hydratase/2-oxohepta-3-ene-1,7-dioic acid hydratase in catechol pathway